MVTLWASQDGITMTALRKIAAKPRDITEKPGHAPLAFPRLIKVTRASQSLLKVYEVQETGDGVQTLRRLDLGADKTDPRQIESRLVAIARDYCTHHDAGVLALLAAGSACQFYLSGKCHKKTYGTRDAFAEACFGVSDRTVREWIKAYNLFEDIGGLKVASPTRIYQLTVLGKIKPHFRRRAWAETSTANYGKSASGAAIMRWAERNDALIEASPKNDPSHIPDLPLSNDFEAEIFIKDLGDRSVSQSGRASAITDATRFCCGAFRVPINCLNSSVTSWVFSRIAAWRQSEPTSVSLR